MLLIDLTPYLTASGNRILAGVAGRVHDGTATSGGVIDISHASQKGIDSNLWQCMRHAVDDQKLHIALNSIDTGAHAINSRHYTGRAADSNRVGAVGGMLLPASITNQYAMQLVVWLMAHGFHVGEGRPWPAILFGPIKSPLNPTSINHSDHLHVSLPRKKTK